MNSRESFISGSPESTFELGEKIASGFRGGEVLLLTGGLGAGKTLFTKGVMNALDYDVDEVSSPSFALVNLYKADRFNVYHIDLWRTAPGPDAGFSVGLDEILEDESAVVIIEWAERLGRFEPEGRTVYSISISGDGDDPRSIEITRTEQISTTHV